MGIKTKTWKYIKRDIAKNFPRFVSSNGVFIKTAKYEIRDLDWNHMDGLHRPKIHNTYHESLKIAYDKSFQLNFTRIGLTPFIIPVFDLKIDEGEFYQTFSIFNLFTVISYTKLERIKNSKVKQTIEWEIFSHPWLKFMHKYISKKIYKLNKVQSDEDFVIRERRFNLRKLGYRFGTDNPNFVNSNDLSLKIIPPANKSSQIISLQLDDFEIDKKTYRNK